MCKLLSELTNTNKAVLKEMILRLENRAAHPGIDMRLTSEIYSTAHLKTRALGLDPNDTTGKELYAALRSMTMLHDSMLMKHFGLTASASTNCIQDVIMTVIAKLNLPKQSQVIKPALLKAIIKQNPPKRLMKQLGYRTVDSLIKRETPGAIVGIARYTESQSWLLKLQAAYRAVQPYDMVLGTIDIQLPTSKKWHTLSQQLLERNHNPVIIVPEAGEVIMLPLNRDNRPGYTLMLLSLVIHAVKEIRMLSSYLKYQQMNPQFGKLLTDTLFFDTSMHVSVVGQEIHWRSFHRHYAKTVDISLMFHPHIQAEDFAYRSAEEVLYRLEPALAFWQNLDYVGLNTEHGPISFSLMDNVFNLVNNSRYEERYTQHMKQAVWDELYARYLGTDHIYANAMRTLEPQHAQGQAVYSDFEFAL